MSNSETNLDDEATVLDSEFGQGNASEKFGKMGFPQGTSKHRWSRWFLFPIFFLILFFVFDSKVLNFDGLNKTRKEKIKVLNRHLELSDWNQGREFLKEFAIQDPLQELNQWLNQMIEVESKVSSRDWSQAYALLKNLPQLPEYCSSEIYDNVLNKQKLILDEIEVSAEWQKINRNALKDIKFFLDKIPRNSVYYSEVKSQLDLVSDQLLDKYKRDFLLKLEEENWAEAEGILAKTMSDLDHHDFTSWVHNLNLHRRNTELYRWCYDQLIQGKFLIVMSRLSEGFQGPYQEELEAIRRSLAHLATEGFDKDRVFNQIENGNLEQAILYLSQSDLANPILEMIFNHWKNLESQIKKMHMMGEDTLEDQMKLAVLAGNVLSKMPDQENSLYKEIESNYLKIKEKLKEHKKLLENLLKDAWYDQNYSELYLLSMEILRIDVNHAESLDILNKIQSVATQILHEIYILNELDQELARARCSELKKILPVDHDFLRKAGSIIRFN